MFFGFKKKREKTYPVSHAAFNYSITPVSHSHQHQTSCY